MNPEPEMSAVAFGVFYRIAIEARIKDSPGMNVVELCSFARDLATRAVVDLNDATIRYSEDRS